MPKTHFIDGTIVTPDYLNTIYETSNGHSHDGADSDGNAKKINLSAAAECSGLLPYTNFAYHPFKIDGFIIRSDDVGGGDAIYVSKGLCMDSTGAEPIYLSSQLKKLCNASWAAGNNNGARPSSIHFAGPSASYLYVFVIKKSDGTVDVGIDSNVAASNLLSSSGYQYYRRIGCIPVYLNTGLDDIDIPHLRQDNGILTIFRDYFTSPGATFTEYTFNSNTPQTPQILSLPPIIDLAYFDFGHASLDKDYEEKFYILLTNPASSQTAGYLNWHVKFYNADFGLAYYVSSSIAGHIPVHPDNSSQIRVSATTGNWTDETLTFDLHLTGWFDARDMQ